MKLLAFLLTLGFISQSSDARTLWKDTKTCLVENGVPDDLPNISLMMNIGEPDVSDMLMKIPKEKIASIFACIYQKEYKDKQLSDSLEQLIDRNDRVSEEERAKMAETLITCKANAAGNDTKLLDCINLTIPPFDAIIATIRDVPDSLDPCFLKCMLTIGELNKMEQNRNKVLEVAKEISHLKLGCVFSCKLDEYKKIHPEGPTPSQRISELINRSKNHDKSWKKELLESLKRCSDKVTGREHETDQLIKCLDLFQTPFIDILI